MAAFCLRAHWDPTFQQMVFPHRIVTPWPLVPAFMHFLGCSFRFAWPANMWDLFGPSSQPLRSGGLVLSRFICTLIHLGRMLTPHLWLPCFSGTGMQQRRAKPGAMAAPGGDRWAHAGCLLCESDDRHCLAIEAVGQYARFRPGGPARRVSGNFYLVTSSLG